jgi:GT2 family glycosyltransferase
MEADQVRPTPDVSVVIVSWNTAQLLAECITSIAGPDPRFAPDDPAQVVVDGLGCEVVVVDNASSDNTPSLICDRFPWVQMIANNENVGVARANNQGLRAGRGRYFLMLNPDTAVHPGSLRTLVDFMDRHPEVGAAGPRVFHSDGTLQLSSDPDPTLGRELWRLFHLDRIHPYALYRMEKWDTQTPRAVDSILGACMLVPRQVLHQVGPLDEDFFIYSEEVELCSRIRRHGLSVCWVPRATVVHHGAQSTRQAATEMFLRLYAAKVLYFRKQHGTFAARVYKLILALAALPRVGLSPISRIEWGERRTEHQIMARRYRKLIMDLPAY